MLSLDSELHLPEHVVFTFVEQDAILLNTRTNMYFALDDVGRRFWELFKEGKSLKDGYQLLLDEYDVAPEQLEKDLLELIDDLVEHGLVEVAEA
jgi:hypothetical protein